MADRIRAAAASHQYLRIRGGGTKDFYGASLQGELLSTTALTGITSYEPSELVVTVRSGTPLAALEAALAEHGQCLPFEPPYFGYVAGDGAVGDANRVAVGVAGSAATPGHSPASTAAEMATTGATTATNTTGTGTVGGMVSVGLSGPARASVGAVRDYVLGMTLISGRGELLTFGGQVMKNVAGYDVSRLVTGALGTLGLITEVSLKVLPVAPAEATLRFECSQAEGLRMLHAWGGQPLPLNASCWVQEDFANTSQGRLYVRLRGAVAAVQAACKRMGGVVQNNAQAAADWTACRNHTLPWFAARGLRDLWRLSVPQTTPVLTALDARFGRPLVEWHGGQRWYFADGVAGASAINAGHASHGSAALAIREAAAAAGGSATLFIATNTENTAATTCFDALSAPLERIHRELKQQFDPAGILNPGRMYTGW